MVGWVTLQAQIPSSSKILHQVINLALESECFSSEEIVKTLFIKWQGKDQEGYMTCESWNNYNIGSHILIFNLIINYFKHIIVGKVKVLVAQSGPTLCDLMDCSPPGYMDFSSKKTVVGSHSSLQMIFPTQWSNSGLLHCRQILYHLILYQYSSVDSYVPIMGPFNKWWDFCHICFRSLSLRRKWKRKATNFPGLYSIHNTLLLVSQFGIIANFYFYRRLIVFTFQRTFIYQHIWFFPYTLEIVHIFLCILWTSKA